MPENQPHRAPQGPSLFSLLTPYRAFVAALVALTIVSNGLSLTIPSIISNAVDRFTAGTSNLRLTVILFIAASAGVFVFTYVQSIVQVYVSERVARDLRDRLIKKISEQDYAYVQRVTPAKLLTHLTSDVDAVKNFVSQAVASLISSAVLILGTSVLLLRINVRLALVVLAVVPVIGITFFIVFSRVRKLFKRVQEAIDWLNKVINESILGAALIRLVNSSRREEDKFLAANAEARTIGLGILRLFSLLIPFITLAANLATLAIVLLGGRYIMQGTLTLGELTAFNGYLAILIFPIIIIGFMSNVIAQATASFQRIGVILNAPAKKASGTVVDDLSGAIAVRHLSMVYGERSVVKDVSFDIAPRTKTAIIGPTAAGKSQLLCLMTGLLEPSAGTVMYDGKMLGEFDPERFHDQVGFVFQDSLMFNTTLRENIAFNSSVTDADLERAIETAELKDFVAGLPEGLSTIVSERGTSLSGGQKQRVMLARALALNPRILFLDDFTARVDAATEQRVLANVAKNYPDVTLISVTQKIAPVTNYDQIIVLMEGELLAKGRHEELMDSSPEYVQIFNSQQSTNAYEVHA